MRQEYNSIGLFVLGLNEHIEKRLVDNGYDTIGSLLKCATTDISGIEKIGESSVRQIRRRLIGFLQDFGDSRFSSKEAKADAAVREVIGI